MDDCDVSTIGEMLVFVRFRWQSSSRSLDSTFLIRQLAAPNRYNPRD